MNDIKSINLEGNKKPQYNTKSIVWTNTSGASIKYKIKMFFIDIKHFFQRGKYGYCRTDVWDLDGWFINIMPKMLGDLIEGHVGFPGTEEVPTDERWVEILTEMKHCFEEASEETCSEKNEYEDAFTIESFTRTEEDKTYFDLIVSDEDAWEKYKQRGLEIAEYQNRKLNRGLELFEKYFHHLWD